MTCQFKMCFPWAYRHSNCIGQQSIKHTGCNLKLLVIVKLYHMPMWGSIIFQGGKFFNLYMILYALKVVYVFTVNCMRDQLLGLSGVHVQNGHAFSNNAACRQIIPKKKRKSTPMAQLATSQSYFTLDFGPLRGWSHVANALVAPSLYFSSKHFLF